MKSCNKPIKRRENHSRGRNPTLLIVLTSVVSFCFASCNKFVKIDLPPDQIESEIVFSDQETATSAIVGLYSEMVRTSLTLTNGGMTLYPGLSADEISNTSANQIYDAFSGNELASDNRTVATNFWDNAYRNIYQCNSILEGLRNSKGIKDSVRNELKGEAEFVRSFYYFYLVNLFGDVPLITGTDYRVNAVMPRTPVAQIYEKITGDLKDAVSVLPEEYVTSGRVRPNKWAAETLLSRVYLYQGDWQNAGTSASDVIQSGMYTLEADLNKVFLAGSNEAIWQLLKKSNNTAEAASFIPRNSTTKPAFALTGYLLGAFENGDMRKAAWTDSNVVDQKAYYYPYKYKVRQSSDVTEYLIVFRLAELYLIRAEAEAELNDISGAQKDIDRIRNRAGLPNTTAADKDALLQAILHERQLELFCEWGHRWLDLKRSGHIDEVLGAEKQNWQSFSALYPIPQDEIQINKYLLQNPGYN